MISNFICCCDCEYQEICHNFDAFFGCPEGVAKSLNEKLENDKIENVSLLSKNNAKLYETTE